MSESEDRLLRVVHLIFEGRRFTFRVDKRPPARGLVRRV